MPIQGVITRSREARKRALARARNAVLALAAHQRITIEWWSQRER
jgi:hypothetical protein